MQDQTGQNGMPHGLVVTESSRQPTQRRQTELCGGEQVADQMGVVAEANPDGRGYQCGEYEQHNAGSGHGDGVDSEQ